MFPTLWIKIVGLHMSVSTVNIILGSNQSAMRHKFKLCHKDFFFFQQHHKDFWFGGIEVKIIPIRRLFNVMVL